MPALQTWLLTLVACLSVTMSTSNIDSYQNAIVDNISGVFLRNQNVLWSRLLVLALNAPCIAVSVQVSVALLTQCHSLVMQELGHAGEAGHRPWP